MKKDLYKKLPNYLVKHVINTENKLLNTKTGRAFQEHFGRLKMKGMKVYE